jgi:hypothetical protein
MEELHEAPMFHTGTKGGNNKKKKKTQNCVMLVQFEVFMEITIMITEFWEVKMYNIYSLVQLFTVSLISRYQTI